jgi:hypothetical protein
LVGGKVMKFILTILIVSVILTAIMFALMRLFAAIFADSDWLEIGEDGQKYLDNSEYDYGHDVRYDDDFDNI